MSIDGGPHTDIMLLTFVLYPTNKNKFERFHIKPNDWWTESTWKCCHGTTAVTVAANGGLSNLEFNPFTGRDTFCVFPCGKKLLDKYKIKW